LAICNQIDLPIIFITGHGDVQMSVKAIKAGATNFLEKPFSNETLVESINVACSRTDDSKKQRQAAAEIRQRHATLTERELEVMQYVVAGMSNRELAELLGLSQPTIEAHRLSIMKMMGAASLPGLVRKYSMCRQAGLK
jgi:FixJ family two-component response regulator